MKNNVLIVSVFIILFFMIIYTFKESESDRFILETKEEIKSFEKDKETVFEMADKTIELLDVEKRNKLHMLDSLDIKLSEKQKIVNSYIQLIKENKILNNSLEFQNKKLIEEKELLIESLKKVTSINEVTNEKLEKTNKEKEYLENQYFNLSKSHEENNFFVVDTVYIVDTIYYRKEEIKKLILKVKNR